MSDVSINLNERNYKFAFSVESFLHPKQRKSDPRYVKYLFRMYGQRNGEEFQRIIPYHNCTDEEFDQFYPVRK